jgi:hypothetical protein
VAVLGIVSGFGLMQIVVKLDALSPVDRLEEVPPQIVLGTADGVIDGKE